MNRNISEIETQLEDGDISVLEEKTKTLIESFETHKTVVKSKFREIVEALVIALILALFIREFAVQAFKIPSRSMEKTLLVGDHILVWKCYYGIRIPFTKKKLATFTHPEKGDIVVFTPPHDPKKDFIKRVVAVAGDKIEMRNDKVYINDEFVKEDFVNPPARAYRFSSFPPKKVEEGMLFVMGDNRGDSFDSRGWGFLPEKNVKGKAFIVYFPWVTSQEIEDKNLNPYNFFKRLRWKRFFHLIR